VIFVPKVRLMLSRRLAGESVVLGNKETTDQKLVRSKFTTYVNASK